MAFSHFSHNGELLASDDAKISLSNIEYAYGYGVYETIRVSHGKANFVDQHCQRLIESAKILNLEHGFTPSSVKAYIGDLLDTLGTGACNLKILLIGGREPQLYILPLNPLFPDRKLYKQGVHTITYSYERPFPHAKSLNMLQSYLAYRDARQAGAYDALLINQRGNVTEGTRTNFFAIKDRMIYSPPPEEILLGVTRDNVLKVARDNNFEITEKDMPLDKLDQYDGIFITSTSSKIMPVSSINKQKWDIPDSLRQLMDSFSKFMPD